MSTGSRFPDCPYFETNCFAFRRMGDREKCTILSDTYFNGRKECPFFKTNEQYQRDCRKYPVRVMAYCSNGDDEDE